MLFNGHIRSDCVFGCSIDDCPVYFCKWCVERLAGFDEVGLVGLFRSLFRGLSPEFFEFFGWAREIS
jgi:hypothetical protein